MKASTLNSTAIDRCSVCDHPWSVHADDDSGCLSDCGPDLCPCNRSIPGTVRAAARGAAKAAPKNGRSLFINDLRLIQEQLRILCAGIDELGELAFSITSDERCDQIGCYASNVLQGSQALLREMEIVVMRAGKKKGRGR